jgi:hypothetical protein
MALKEYTPGTAFTGVIGRTFDVSKPAWPRPLRAKSGAPNILFIVQDDTGFGQLGCYGAPIKTPNLDALAADGLLFNNMHTTALCSPTRSCVLTGRNHHSNAMACITEGATGYPGSNGNIPFENGFLSEMLLQQGYNTYAIGKWHLTPADQSSAAGSYDRWPLGRGFERFYGFLGGDTHQYYPELIYDNHSVEPEKTPEQGYHLTEDLNRAFDVLAANGQPVVYMVVSNIVLQRPDKLKVVVPGDGPPSEFYYLHRDRQRFRRGELVAHRLDECQRLGVDRDLCRLRCGARRVLRERGRDRDRRERQQHRDGKDPEQPHLGSPDMARGARARRLELGLAFGRVVQIRPDRKQRRERDSAAERHICKNSDRRHEGCAPSCPPIRADLAKE